MKKKIEPDRVKPSKAFRTKLGLSLHGFAEDVLSSKLGDPFQGNVDLVFTSPPFPLNTKKKYDNLQGDAYVAWLKSFAQTFKKLIKPTGSIVMEVGNSWEPGKPVMSTLALESLLAFLKEGGFHLCQQFIWHNPAKLPSPAQWVTIERIRIKDSYTHLWWMSPNERPKADNRRVLVEYSAAMNRLLETKTYNSGHRPSQHKIGASSFLTNNNGAIPSSVLVEADTEHDNNAPSNVITLANTHASTDYQNYCREHGHEPHPARMPIRLAEFFIKFLTETNDLVVDPFAGSNTTGAAAESLSRRWVSIEPNQLYVEGSKGRFPKVVLPKASTETTASGNARLSKPVKSVKCGKSSKRKH